MHPAVRSSHTLYTAWTGDAGALLDPQDPHTTLFYYSGGNGPHSGSRDDSIGLARATTHAYVGLRSPPAATQETTRQVRKPTIA
jgi:hypothetical protein